MATLFFGVTGPTLDLRQDLTILDTDAPRIMAYLMASPYGTVTGYLTLYDSAGTAYRVPCAV